MLRLQVLPVLPVLVSNMVRQLFVFASWVRRTDRTLSSAFTHYERKSHHHDWWPLLYFYNPSMGFNNQGHTHATWHLTTLRPKTTLLIAELIKTFVCGHWQDNKTAIILVRKSLSVPLYQRLIPSLWRGSHISSHTGSNFHCSSFLSQSPPHSPVVETINSATFHKAVWWGYHLNSLPRPFLSSFAPTAALSEWLNVERRP